MKEYEGYKVGKMLCYIQDPEIISFAGGLPSSDIFPLDLIQKAAEQSLKEDPVRVLQYSSIPGEKELMEAIIDYLQKDGIHIKLENIMITTSGQHGLDLLGRLFLDPKDFIVADCPTFGGALASFELEDAEYIAKDIEEDGSDVEGMEAEIENFIAKGKRYRRRWI